MSQYWGVRDVDPRSTTYTNPTSYSGPVTYGSKGFCPYWTYCSNPDTHPDGTVCSAANNNDVDTTNWLWTVGGNNGTDIVCLDNDPDSRHFCMNSVGQVNPTGTDYQCDKNYDAMDFAMDMTDFAGLQNYTSKAKGNFIAMYSIYFQHGGGDPANDMLGVKMLRYMADAGDNGVIDNAVQHWYRDMRDNYKGQNPSSDVPPNGVNPPPVGGNCVTSAANCVSTTANAAHKGGLTGTIQMLDPRTHPDNDIAYWPSFGLSNFTSVYADPCVAVESTITTNCGQYFFASSAKSVNAAFLQIASRLFTRLSR